MTRVFIDNDDNCIHLEVAVSLITQYNDLLRIPKRDSDIVYLRTGGDCIKYVRSAHPDVVIEKPLQYDYRITVTAYPKDLEKVEDDGVNYYICHNVFQTPLKNVIFLTPLGERSCSLTHLPYRTTKRATDVPIYVIQGNIASVRRNYDLLLRILQHDHKYDFRIKVVGRGKLPATFDRYADKLILRYDLGFESYHHEFADCYGILPLISKASHPHYYTRKLTSSINYGLGYDLQFVIDSDLQEIYNLKNACVYAGEDIATAFAQSLYRFYNKPHKLRTSSGRSLCPT